MQFMRNVTLLLVSLLGICGVPAFASAAPINCDHLGGLDPVPP